VRRVHAEFPPLNRAFGPLMTRWQLRPTRDDPLAFNDHTDLRYDDRILRELGRLSEQLGEVMASLDGELPRLEVHHPRIADALGRVLHGHLAWVDSPEVASMNIVWIQLHEDLLSTLGIRRRQARDQKPLGCCTRS